MLKTILLVLLLLTSLNAYESEDKLKVVIIGKVAKYITYQNAKKSDYFIITVLKNPFETLFDDIYSDKTIKSKPVKINYINTIDALEFTHILYIPEVSSKDLSRILHKTQHSNILTISDARGFAQRGGVMQLYFVSQKLKIKINTYSAKLQEINIQPTLLRIADVVKGEK
ncbi:MAG: hypothetical protein DRG24_07885 [Epsilonproteobacteria bacterium]|nr:MAG: hypothetical protein DRG24_07885 [Campylobacterota bacterium]